MAKVNYRIRLDVGKNGSQGIIYAHEGDARTRSMVIGLYNGSSPVVLPTGATAVLQIARPDQTFSLTDCDISGNIISVNVTSYMTSCVGNNECQLLISDPADEGTLYSPSFDLFVEDTIVSPDDVAALPEFSALSTALNAAAAYRTKWSNPQITVENAETPSGSISFTDTGVKFDIKVQQGRPAEIGDREGFIVETGEDGVLVANRRLVVSTLDPEDYPGLQPGDIYVKY